MKSWVRSAWNRVEMVCVVGKGGRGGEVMASESVEIFLKPNVRKARSHSDNRQASNISVCVRGYLGVGLR